MRPFYKILLRIFIIFAIAFFAIQPYNWYCGITQSCDSFSLYDLAPFQEGTIPVEVFFEIKSYSSKLAFEPLEPSITTVSNKKNIVTYRVKNLSKDTIRFRPKLVVTPKYFEDGIVTYECLCSHLYKLKPKEVRELQMKFLVKWDAINAIQNKKKNGEFVEKPVIRYEVGF
jgi:cytochrome c oxidase assembly protein Cox11